MAGSRITGLGAPLVDMLAPISEEDLARLGATKGTMELMEPARAQSLLEQITIPTQAPGGAVANTIAGLAALGLPTGFMGAVGSDARGKFFRAALETQGTRCALLTTPAAPTGCVVVLLTPDSERTMFTLLGASVAMEADALDRELLAQSQILFGEAYSWDTDAPRYALLAAAAAVRENGGEVAFSLADPLCVARHRAGLQEFVRVQTDIVLANENEAQAFYEVGSFDEALAAARAQKLTGAFTRSAKGAVILENGEAYEIAAKPPAQIQDLTGAGDMFAAGYLAGRVLGAPPPKAGELGAACAAEVIAHIGARPKRALTFLREAAGLSRRRRALSQPP